MKKNNVLTRVFVLILLLCHSICVATTGSLKQGEQLFKDGEYKEAIEKLFPIAKKGNVEAQFLLGESYLESENRTELPNEEERTEEELLEALRQSMLNPRSSKDYPKAIYWLEKAASQGYVKAQSSLAYNYYAWTEYEAAAKWASLAAKAGDETGQLILGLCYYYGNGVAKDVKESMKWLQKPAQNGNPMAQIIMAECYFKGADGVPKNYTRALSLYLKLADLGVKTAYDKLGTIYLNGLGTEKNEKEAVKWIKLAAIKGDAFNQYRLGCCYKEGIGVQQDSSEGFVWFLKAAKQNQIYAVKEVGKCYFEGRGVPQNYEEAIVWFFKAAKEGDLDSEYFLGCCFRDGYGVEKSSSKSVFWFRKAAEKGDKDAQCALGIAYYCGNGVHKNESHAEEWLLKSAKQGNSAAQKVLGQMYIDGVNGREPNYSRAVFCFRKAVEQGDSSAIFSLAYAYKKQKKYIEAFNWLKKGAEYGFVNCQTSLAGCYYFGDGVEKNYTKASYWYKIAAEQGDDFAQYMLGYCYLQGKGVDKNISNGIYWLKQSANQGNNSAIELLNELDY